MLYPLTFTPIFQERIWGGRNLHSLYGKKLPTGVPIGESWEIVDRPDAQSVVANGPLAGKTLHWLLQHHTKDLLGSARAQGGRFPLLVKILDAREKLSLQVHPPASQAMHLGGEPKTEMWYITRAEPGAELYVGLKNGVTRGEFESRIKDGSVAECFHRIPVEAGDSMFLPSGRVHAIGAGLVIFEIQQNSDTTYRVFDWNRTDAQGKPRQLHVEQSLKSIDFDDFEPSPTRSDVPREQTENLHIQTLVEDPLFTVELISTIPPAHIDYSLLSPRVIGVIEGQIDILHPEHPVSLAPGQFALLPASMERCKIESRQASKFLVAQPG